jgi:glycosyltransferase involved in cell wall biosynthesis
MTMAFVSVIITVYNRVQYIYDAIDSVLNQTYQNYEIIVVNDGSTTDVKQALEPYMSRIKYLYQENKGLAAARNYGIKNSSGNYLAFLDDDDLFEPKKLEVQVQILENNSEIGFVYSDCYEFDSNNTDASRLNHAVGRDEPASEFAKLFFMDPNVRVPTFLIRRECFNYIGLFDESLLQNEDGDMLLRVALQWKVQFSDYISARVRNHGKSMSQNKIVLRTYLIESWEKILNSYPNFETYLGADANKTLSYYHYLLAHAYLKDDQKSKALNEFILCKKLGQSINWRVYFYILSLTLRTRLDILVKNYFKFS